MTSELHGLLPVYKPMGMTSKDVSRFLTKLLGKLKMGHVGTLDPMAEGVLPILIGKATRLQDFLLNSGKAYEFDLTLGYATDTFDALGQTTETADYAHVTRDLVEKAVSELIGEHLQTPPLYSAVKFQGKKLYQYGRSGESLPIDIEQLARPITVFQAELVAFQESIITVRVECSKGTYVRTLGQDIAAKLNTCGTVTRLIRSKTCAVVSDECLTLPQIQDLYDKSGTIASLVIPMHQIKMEMPSLRIDKDSLVIKLKQGQKPVLHFDEIKEALEPKSFLPSFPVENIVLLKDKHHLMFAIGCLTVVDQSGSTKVALKRSLE